MPTIYKKRNQWYIDCVVNGKKYTKNTKLEATKINKVKAEKLKDEIEKLLQSGNFIISTSSTIQELAEKFKNEHISLKSESHQTLFKSSLSHFYKIVPPEAKIESITSAHTAAFIKHLSSHVKNATMFTYINYMKIFFNFLVKEEIILKTPFKKNQLPLKERHVIRTFEDEVLDLILEEAKKRDSMFYNILMLLLLTGQRPIDIVKLKAGDFDFKLRYILIDIQKTGIQIRFPMHDRLFRFLQENVPYISEMKSDELIFKDYNIYSLGKKFRRLKKKLGITEKNIYTLKTFRKTFATNLVMNGVERTKVADLLGHTDVKTTRKYYASITTEKLRNELNEIYK